MTQLFKSNGILRTVLKLRVQIKAYITYWVFLKICKEYDMSMIVHIFTLRHTQSSESKLMLMYQYMTWVLKSNIIIVWHRVVIRYDFVITNILSYINSVKQQFLHSCSDTLESMVFM